MKQFKKIISVLVSIFTYILLVVLVLVIYGKCSLMFTDKGYPSYFGYTMFEVASGSMEPTLYVDDVILVRITRDNLKKGDIIAFVNEDVVITHRILLVDGDIITVKGDKNNTIDKPIERDQVIGKVVKVLPKFGIWKKIVTEPKILFAIFITLVLFDFALSYNKDKDKVTEKPKKRRKKIKIVEVEEPLEEDEVTEEQEEVQELLEDKKEEQVETTDFKPTKNSDVIESEKLLEITRKIDIEEINRLLENDEIKLSKKEINNINHKLDKIEKKEDKEVNLSQKEKKFLEYTLRLDLNEIQKKITKKTK